jgi:hypothetical protein
MNHSTAAPTVAAIPLSAEHLAVLAPLLPTLGLLAQTLIDFQAQAPSPVATAALEERLQGLSRELGRTALESTLNAIEPDDEQQLPQEIRLGGIRYRRRRKSPQTIDSTFGPLRLRRWLYEPRADGEACCFPLEHLLGLVAGRVSPALAERVGRLSAEQTQRQVLDTLEENYALHWSTTLLRDVAAEVAALIGPHRQAAQAEQIIDWLRKAWDSRGRFDPVLAVGRDGIMVPLLAAEYREASVATLAVYDRRGRRLGTVYLGWMPQKQQEELSRQLTALLTEVLARWRGRRPRLAYLSDGGSVAETYYRQVLRQLQDPRRPGEPLCWQRVIDYYHAAGYLSKLAEALFGEGKRARRWAKRMRHLLKQHDGLKRVLQSASYHRNEQKLKGKRQKAFNAAYAYLHKRRKYMAYAQYRAVGIPIGSGVTEAGCKVVVTQRLKRSGMGWKRPGGQVVLTLRVILLSGVWRRAWNAHLAQLLEVNNHSYAAYLPAKPANAA